MSCVTASPRRQRGVGMLEVLVALLIVAFGALGYAGLQLTALRNSTDANDRAHAAMIAQDAIERIKANPAEAEYYANSTNWPETANAESGGPDDWKGCMNSACESDEMASWDIKQLVWSASFSLPGGRVMAMDCAFNSMGCVIVSWEDQEPSQCISNTGINTADDSKCLVMEISL